MHHSPRAIDIQSSQRLPTPLPYPTLPLRVFGQSAHVRGPLADAGALCFNGRMLHKTHYLKTTPLGVALLICCVLCGCRGRGVQQVPVSGTVTLDGGPMPGPGTIYFTPVSATDGAPLRPSSAPFAADGRYVAGSFGEGGGLIPGSYKVAIHCWKISPNMEGVPGESFIPQRYQSAGTSGLEFTVSSGGGMTKDFKLTTK